jgi:predicted CoA-substrate-specific enzyme activase
MSVSAGVDIGSTASKVVILGDEGIVGQIIGPSTTDPARTAREIYERALEMAGVTREEVAMVVGTGYGRTLVPFADHNVSEITCHGRGAHFLRPSTRTVIDIGGQDTKVISLDGRGDLLDFAMNDKCAAGTGRFLEAMARSMNLSLEGMAELSGRDVEPCSITNMCSVFAESEVINLINDGVEVSRIVKGLLAAMANRVAGLARRLGVEEAVVLTGGVAKNRGVLETLAKKLSIEIRPLEGADPQLVGALGAALVARELSGAARG